MRDGVEPLMRGEEENPWLLPEGIEEVLPPDAWALERLGRAVLDLYRGWGYALVIPPLLEYLESLLAGTGQDMALRTFKVTDQISGRMMGLRADITPQVARIDAHVLQDAAPTRLCYLGTVLHSRADSIHATRSPFQAGAELYGHLGLDSDLEVLLLMLETLRVAGLTQELCVDIGHMGLYRALVQATGIDAGQEPVLFSLLQRKAVAELEQVLSGWKVPGPLARALCDVAACCSGDRQLLERARTVLLPVLQAPAVNDVEVCLRELEQLDVSLTARCDAPVTVRYDLCELRGYRYHTGVNFAACCSGHGAALAVGGRYDGIGQAFGRARPATGFSLDLRTLLRVARVASEARHEQQQRLIFAPAEDDPALRSTIRSLREQGDAVLVELSGQAEGAAAMGCSHVLERRAGQWQLRALEAG